MAQNLLYLVPVVRKLSLVSQNLIFNAIYRRYFDHRVSIFGFPIVSFAPVSHVKVGKNLVLISESYFSQPGVNHPVILRTLSSEARLVIGNNVGISGGGICAAKEVVIGDNVMVGANAFITDTDFHPLDPAGRRFSSENVLSEKVEVEENVFIGMSALILKGVRIGKNSVIGAGSIVTTSIPANCIASGIPARVIRQL
jgi:acetyltransferase-like isoleucine patch superfamily enzyme